MKKLSPVGLNLQVFTIPDTARAADSQSSQVVEWGGETDFVKGVINIQICIFKHLFIHELNIYDVTFFGQL